MNTFRAMLSLLVSFLLVTPSIASPIAARRINAAALEQRASKPPALPSFGPDPTLSHFVTATLSLGPAFPLVPIAGGVREGKTQLPMIPMSYILNKPDIESVQPVNGTVAGPGLNGTIINGIAYPTVVNNETTAFVELLVYGETNDKVPFMIQSSGVGVLSRQYVSLVSSHSGFTFNLHHTVQPLIGITFRLLRLEVGTNSWRIPSSLQASVGLQMRQRFLFGLSRCHDMKFAQRCLGR